MTSRDFFRFEPCELSEEAKTVAYSGNRQGDPSLFCHEGEKFPTRPLLDQPIEYCCSIYRESTSWYCCRT
jgi:hypothetical protein